VKRAVIMAEGIHINAVDLELETSKEDDSSLPLNLKKSG